MTVFFCILTNRQTDRETDGHRGGCWCRDRQWKCQFSKQSKWLFLRCITGQRVHDTSKEWFTNTWNSTVNLYRTIIKMLQHSNRGLILSTHWSDDDVLVLLVWLLIQTAGKHSFWKGNITFESKNKQHHHYHHHLCKGDTKVLWKEESLSLSSVFQV